MIFNLFELISSRSTVAALGRREFTVKCSFVQIYNEQILDLFNPSHLRAPASSSSSGRATRLAPNKSASGGGLKLRWSAAREFYVENLRVLECQTPEQVIQHFQDGIKHKVMASHRLNAASSRSHCVFTIYVESYDPTDDTADVLESKLALVDLAGSERIDKTGATGVTLQESIGINKSLFVLRQVIQALSEESSSSASDSKALKHKDTRDRAYIPYRDSKLTSLLKYSLGGNSLTLMIACLSPSDAHFDENLSTLVYASKAQCIANKPTRNEDPKTVLIHELRLEVASLQTQLAQAQDVILSFQDAAVPQQALTCSTCLRKGESNAVAATKGDEPETRDSDAPEQPQSQQQQELNGAPEAMPAPVVSAPSTTEAATPATTSRASSLTTLKTRAAVESATTKRLKLNVIDNVAMIKQLYATEKALSDRVRVQSSRIDDLQYETRVLSVENQSLRDKIEVLEYLVANLPQRRESNGNDDNNRSECDEIDVIPEYGTLTASWSLPRVGGTAAAPPPAERIRDVLRASRASRIRSAAPAAPENEEMRASAISDRRSNQRHPEQPTAKRKDLDTGLLSVRLASLWMCMRCAVELTMMRCVMYA